MSQDQRLLDILGIVATAVGIGQFIFGISVFVLRTLRMRSLLSRLLFLGGTLATTAVLTGIAVAFLPAFTSVVSNITIGNLTISNVAIGNSIAVVGLGIALVSWVVALYLALHARHWLVFLVMIVVGLPIYTGAIIFNDFASYLLVGAVPSYFGLFGPDPAPVK